MFVENVVWFLFENIFFLHIRLHTLPSNRLDSEIKINIWEVIALLQTFLEIISGVDHKTTIQKSSS